MSKNISDLAIENKPDDANIRYKVLLINPNTSKTMTANALKLSWYANPPDVAVYGYTAPENSGPTAIEGHLDSVLSAASVFKDVYDYVGQVDACLVACFSDHPLINCLREEFNIPICGIFEAAIYSARLLGGRFGILATSYRSQIRHADSVRKMGLEGSCAGLLSSGLTVPELESKPIEEVLQMMETLAERLVIEMDADTVILGCCGMSLMQETIEKVMEKHQVPVIDGVVAGVGHLVGLLRANYKTAKRGMYASSGASRVARHQEYI